MSGAPGDGVSQDPPFVGGIPNSSGWFPVFDTDGNRVAAVRIREGVSFEEAKKAWQKNDSTDAAKAFDIILTRDNVVLDEQGASPNARGAPTRTVRSPEGDRAPGGQPSQGQGIEPTGRPKRTTSEHAKGTKKPKRQFATPPPKPTDRAQEDGSRLGKEDGNVGVEWWSVFVGYAKAFYDGIGEMGVTLWDAGGAAIEGLSDDYEHDYLSTVGRAVADEGRDLGDVLVEGMADRIRAAGRMVEDFGEGDYYAMGVEAQAVPVPGAGGLGGGLVKAGGAVTKGAIGAAGRLRKASKRAPKKVRKGKSVKRFDERRDPARVRRDVNDQPDFDRASFHDTRLPQRMVSRNVSDPRQMRYAMKDLKRELRTNDRGQVTSKPNPKKWDQFTPAEQKALRKAMGPWDRDGVKSPRAKGFRWHHDTHDPTVLRLLKAEVHDYFENTHYGGRFVTGGRTPGS